MEAQRVQSPLSIRTQPHSRRPFSCRSHTTAIGCHSPSKYRKWGEHWTHMLMLSCSLMWNDTKTNECVVLCAHNWYWSQRTYRQTKKKLIEPVVRTQPAELRYTLTAKLKSRRKKKFEIYFGAQGKCSEEEKKIIFALAFTAFRARIGINRLFRTLTKHRDTESINCFSLQSSAFSTITHAIHGSNAHDSPIKCDWLICASVT